MHWRSSWAAGIGAPLEPQGVRLEHAPQKACGPGTQSRGSVTAGHGRGALRSAPSLCEVAPDLKAAFGLLTDTINVQSQIKYMFAHRWNTCLLTEKIHVCSQVKHMFPHKPRASISMHCQVAGAQQGARNCVCALQHNWRCRGQFSRCLAQVHLCQLTATSLTPAHPVGVWGVGDVCASVQLRDHFSDDNMPTLAPSNKKRGAAEEGGVANAPRPSLMHPTLVSCTPV